MSNLAKDSNSMDVLNNLETVLALNKIEIQKSRGKPKLEKVIKLRKKSVERTKRTKSA